ncbi:MAG: S-layer homology domain-containing protein [Acidobacteria bacterium]|jgi:hypothetical protein|nr:S-layer homology domain-containing protein [Acidobacteriota bacterium]
MKRSIAGFAFFVGVVALVISPWAAAQTPDADGVTGGPSGIAGVAAPRPRQMQPDAFGTGNQLTEIHAPNWSPYYLTSPPGYIGLGYAELGQAEASYYWTQLNLPLGATIHTVYAVVYDNDSSANWTFALQVFEAATYGPAPIALNIGAETSTSGTPGYTYLTIDAGDTVIRALADYDLDGTENDVAFDLLLHCGAPSLATNMSFWGASVNWSRTVSPAPATATFVDVPVGAFGFRHIEALAAAGVTGGCDATHYCPNNPVTRAQMAVFLAKALGLHWSY